MIFPKVLISGGGKTALFRRGLTAGLVSLLLLALVCSASVVGVIKVGNSTALPAPASNTVIVDAGHGGFDGGAVVGEVLEKDINLSIANRLTAMLQATGFHVITTRTDDSSTESDPTATISARKKSDLRNRLNLAKENPDAILVSIHLNNFSSASCKGAQMFCSPNNEPAKQLAEQLKNSVITLLQPDNHRTVKTGTKDTFLLYYSPIPAVIAECGFMSNPAELQLLTDEAYQNQMAFAIFSGILNYYHDQKDV